MCQTKPKLSQISIIIITTVNGDFYYGIISCLSKPHCFPSIVEDVAFIERLGNGLFHQRSQTSSP